MPSTGQATLQPVAAEPGRPLYVTVRESIREAVERGRYGPGERLPSTKALSEQMSVSLVTVHRALQDLVSAGVLLRGQGRGTFVHEDFAERTRRMADFRFGLVYHPGGSLADSYHGLILEGVRSRAAELGIDLVILRFGEDWRNECDGYLYVNPTEDQVDGDPRFGGRSAMAGHSAKSQPFVVIGAHFDRPGLSSIDADNVEIGRRAAEYLAGLGHKRVGFVGGSGEISNNSDRWNGFAQAAERLELSIDRTHVLRASGWRLERREQDALVDMLQESNRPTAIFSAGYYYALGMYGAASQAGLTIPGDLSVVGVDDPPSAGLLSPPLTTFRQPLIEMGGAGVDRLAELVRSKNKNRGSDPMKNKESRRTILPAALLERASASGSV